jgi:hypothetical protein
MTMHRPLLPIVASFALACAGAPATKAYIAPTPETIVTTSQETGMAAGQVVTVENHSTVSVTVYSVTLRDCENVKTQCNNPRRLSLKVAPSGHETLIRIEPSDPKRPYRYHYSFAWRADSAVIAALGAAASAGDSVAARRLAAIDRDRRRRANSVGFQEITLTPAEVNAVADQATSLRATPDSIVLARGAAAPLDTIRLLLVDTQGETLGRVRATYRVMVRLPSARSAMLELRKDSIAALASGRTEVEVKLPDDVLPTKPALHGVVHVPIIVPE